MTPRPRPVFGTGPEFCPAASQTRIFTAHQWGGCITTMRGAIFPGERSIEGRLEIAGAAVANGQRSDVQGNVRPGHARHAMPF